MVVDCGAMAVMTPCNPTGPFIEYTLEAADEEVAESSEELEDAEYPLEEASCLTVRFDCSPATEVDTLLDDCSGIPVSVGPGWLGRSFRALQLLDFGLLLP